MILYDAHHLAPCYAVRLLAGLLGVALDRQPMDVYPGHDDHDPAFLARNPRGTLPVLEDGALVLTDWQAILAHLAHRGAPHWLPAHEPAFYGWLGMARDLAASAGQARLIDTFLQPGDLAMARSTANALFDVVERQLWWNERAGHGWLVAPAPSIADIACFVFIAPCEDAGLSLRDRPALRRWCDRIRFLPGFLAMSGVFPPMANTPPQDRTLLT